MRNLTIGVLSIIFALISLPALANSALIAELTRLDDARRTANALHVEYDRTVQIGYDKAKINIAIAVPAKKSSMSSQRGKPNTI